MVWVLGSVTVEIQNVAAAVAAITPPVFDAQNPGIKIQLFAFGNFDINPAEADFVAVDAGEIRLAADLRPEAAIQRVIPDVEFPDARRIDGGDEIAHIMGDGDDVLVRPDAVELGHRVIGQLVRGAAVPAAGRVGDSSQTAANHRA